MSIFQRIFKIGGKVVRIAHQAKVAIPHLESVYALLMSVDLQNRP